MDIQNNLVTQGWQILLPAEDGGICRKHQIYMSPSSYNTANQVKPAQSIQCVLTDYQTKRRTPKL